VSHTSKKQQSASAWKQQQQQQPQCKASKDGKDDDAQLDPQVGVPSGPGVVVAASDVRHMPPPPLSSSL
jgi:hypothetical protein